MRPSEETAQALAVAEALQSVEAARRDEMVSGARYRNGVAWLRSSGWTPAEIAPVLGVSRWTVIRHARQGDHRRASGLDPWQVRGRLERWRQARLRLEVVAVEASEVAGQAAVARVLGVTRQTVGGWCRQARS